MKNSPNIKIYSGLSLDCESALNLLPSAEMARPIGRGDLLRDLDNGLQIAVIVDGTFHQNLAVTPDEIMDALRSGVKVYGASSMGALRASELHPYGMIGHGAIFQHIIKSSSFRDDYLAMLFSDQEGSITKLSITYIDLYMNVQKLETEGRITESQKCLILETYGDIFYAHRDWPTLRKDLITRGADDDDFLLTVKYACARMGSQKRRDAVGLLKKIKADMQRVQLINKGLVR